ncbi:MAG: choice-of-anchor Q domain-containing protein, partial [Planctomycetota bacterium]
MITICIDTGDPNYVGEPNETDLDGNPRVVCDVVDMGAYEFQGILYVDDDAPSDPPPGDPRGTEAHPFDDIQEAIDVARDGYTILVRPGQ